MKVYCLKNLYDGKRGLSHNPYKGIIKKKNCRMNLNVSNQHLMLILKREEGNMKMLEKTP